MLVIYFLIVFACLGRCLVLISCPPANGGEALTLAFVFQIGRDPCPFLMLFVHISFRNVVLGFHLL